MHEWLYKEREISIWYRTGILNLAKTNEIYEGAAEYVKNFNVSRRDMVKFIIGTIGEMDSPLSMPSAKGKIRR